MRLTWKKVLLVLVGLAVVFFGVVIVGSWVATGTGASGARLDAMQASPHWRDGVFVNTTPDSGYSLLASIDKFLRGAEHTSPDSPPPVVDRVASDFDIAPDSGLRITWLGHSTFLVELGGRRVLVDPVFSERPSPLTWMGPRRFHRTPLPLAELPAIDAVVISHDHFDHLDHRTVKALGDRAPVYVVPLGVGAHLEYWGVPADRIVERDWWDSVALGDLTLTATPARHFSGRSLVMADKNETLWAGWVIASPAGRIYYSGDTGLFPDIGVIGERLGPFDAVLVEIGAYDPLWPDLHFGPEQAIEARVALGSGLVIPVHWGTFDLAMHAWTEPAERLLVAAERAGVRVAIPKPGQSVEPAQPPEATRWWPEVPWKSARETPVVSTGLGSNKIAQRR